MRQSNCFGSAGLVRPDLPAAAAAGTGEANYILPHTGKGLYGNNGAKSTADLILWSKKDRKALKRKGWNTFKQPMLTLETFLLQAAVICGILKKTPQKGELFHYAV